MHLTSWDTVLVLIQTKDPLITLPVCVYVCVRAREYAGCTVTKACLVSLVQVRCSETCGHLSILQCRGGQRVEEEEERGTSPHPREAC